MNKIINSIHFLFLLLIMTFMDSYKVFPSKYRPLFLWVLIILFPLALIQEKKISRNFFYLCLAYFYMGSISIVKIFLDYHSFKGFFDYIVTVILCLISYISYRFIFRRVNLKKFDKALFYTGNFLIFIGILEMLSYYRIVPIGIKIFLNNIFTEGYSGRFKLITNEASWASMLLLFYYSYFLTKKKIKESFFIALLIILSFSTQGIISLFIYNLYIYLKRIKKGVFIIFYLTMVLIFSFLFFKILKDLILFLNMKDTYFGSRFFRIEIKSFEEFINIDGSIFVRVGYPLAALKVWTKNLCNFFMGIGGGNYIFEFESAIKDISNSYESYPEVTENIKYLSANVKNIYIRLILEGGVVTVVIVSKFILLTKEKLKKLNNNFLKNISVVLFIIYLQFDSYVYLVFPMILALIDICYEREKVIEENKVKVKNNLMIVKQL